VNGLDLDVPVGIVLGLLGPNGAGKSTTMRMLTGQARATSGRIEVLGLPIPEKSKQARAQMGVVPQLDNLETELTARENLAMYAVLYRVPRHDRHAAVERALVLAQLTARADTKVSELSGGMKRRLLIARGLVHDPDLVLLDEPTVGLDPQVRQDLWSLIDSLRAEGKTVLMSTHYIEEAERLADDVAVMSHGRVVARGAPRALLKEHVGEQAIEFYGTPARLSEIEQRAVAADLLTRRTGPSISILGSEKAPSSLIAEFGDGVPRSANLEDVFVLLTGERLE
jgi:lipooligosaccharide transport system ATP-binding protein